MKNLTQDERTLAKIGGDQIRLAKAADAHQAAAQNALAALSPGGRIEFGQGSRTITLGATEAHIEAGYASAAKGSVFQVPSAAALSTALATGTVEAQIIHLLGSAIPPSPIQRTLSRMIAAAAFSGIWTEADRTTEEGRAVMLMADAARRLPPGHRPAVGMAIAHAAEVGDAAARNVRQAIASVPALLVLMNPQELADAFGPDAPVRDTLAALGYPAELAQLKPGAIRAVTANNVEVVGSIIRHAVSANVWPARAKAQVRVLEALAPVLAADDLPEGFDAWLTRAVCAPNWMYAARAERTLSLWVKRPNARWSGTISPARAVADAVRWLEAETRIAQDVRAKDTEQRHAAFPVVTGPFTVPDSNIGVTPLRSWAELIECSQDLKNCLHVEAYANDCATGKAMIVAVVRTKATPAGGTVSRVTKGKTLSAAELALHKGVWVVRQHFGSCNTTPTAQARNALDLFLTNLNSQNGGAA